MWLNQSEEDDHQEIRINARSTATAHGRIDPRGFAIGCGAGGMAAAAQAQRRTAVVSRNDTRRHGLTTAATHERSKNLERQYGIVQVAAQEGNLYALMGCFFRYFWLGRPELVGYWAASFIHYQAWTCLNFGAPWFLGPCSAAHIAHGSVRPWSF